MSSLELGLAVYALAIMAVGGWLGILGPEGVPTQNGVAGVQEEVLNKDPRTTNPGESGAMGQQGWEHYAFGFLFMLGMCHLGRDMSNVDSRAPG